MPRVEVCQLIHHEDDPELAEPAEDALGRSGFPSDVMS
jgi:hypothetical protein